MNEPEQNPDEADPGLPGFRSWRAVYVFVLGPERIPTARMAKATTALRVAFVGNALPRHCGIATFTTDLELAVRALPDVGETAILAMNDPGEAPLRSSLLVAPHGKGYYVYAGVAFFRQLPAGVPGAYRLFANLLSLGK